MTTTICNTQPDVQLPLFQSSVQGAATVYIIDGDEYYRSSLEALAQAKGWHVEAFGTGAQFLERVCPPVPACIILDASLPDVEGLKLQKQLAMQAPAIPIMFLTEQQDVHVAVQAIKAGAVEFFTKPYVNDELVRAIEKALDRSNSLRMREAGLRELKSRYASLSNREREVLSLVVAGLPNKQVGDHLGISEITVKVHRGNVMRKMKADSLPALVNMAASLRLIRRHIFGASAVA
ncbi:response regulator transcription factor [Terriglobus sp. TAA 43]|uniref:response regulator transcription factor n=1 Tax=Terriglobus sp. TAA 43 TaxID=278961 RepID=UPI000A01F002|nr:LuxR C-terminal-related transcriptional regulator [Terriglobus sp. TAA 43]